MIWGKFNGFELPLYTIKLLDVQVNECYLQKNSKREGHHFVFYVENLKFRGSVIAPLLKMHVCNTINMFHLPWFLFPNLKCHASWEKNDYTNNYISHEKCSPLFFLLIYSFFFFLKNSELPRPFLFQCFSRWCAALKPSCNMV